ncbi:MAG: T9SS type A sorting domain-containing protein [Bacteroidales bacterium]|nr:T9SS type A sorting domain-containing protein [Candidatus Colimorpha merdihippi]
MKSRKVLLGFILGFAMCFAGTVTAQNANFQNDRIVEIGPDNIGGRVTSLVVYDNAAENLSTIYAGAASGGLYTRTDADADIWSYLPCFINGEEVTLPISSMAKFNDSIILVATGESYYGKGNKLNKLAAIGRGIFAFNTNDKVFTRINGTDPARNLDHNFASVNDMQMITLQGTTYLFVATPKGLFRWNVTQLSDLNNAPTQVFEGPVSCVVLSKQFNRAFFANEGNLYKISDVRAASEPVNITGSCTAFGNSVAKRIFLALAPTDESYLYAMVANEKGLMTGLYLTRNTNNWTLLSSSTVNPFNASATAATCGAIAVDPLDPTRVFIAGANLWVGKGYVENSPYQWTVSSSNEASLNGGDYMAQVYSFAQFIHSGFHQIAIDSRWNTLGDYQYEGFYFATDGGVYYSPWPEFEYFENLNRGLNNVQINSVAVTPDGSIISGANSNACPFLESRAAHHGGANDSTWYDQTGGNTNHMANILWKGNGGAVAASRFSQYSPTSRRNIFVSSSEGFIGRAYADYSDFTNTQTWTAGVDFMTDLVANGPEIGQIYLWETDNNTVTNDSITVFMDTLSYIMRNGERHDLSSSFQVKSGDKMMVLDPSHAAYPFWHTFDHNFTVKNEMNQRVHLPYLSRLLAVTVENDMPKNSNVSFCWFPTDFRKVFDESPDTRFWSHIYGVNGTTYPDMAVRYTAMSKDGDCAFVVVENKATKRSMIARVHGFNAVDYNKTVHEIRDMVNYKISTRVTVTDTLMVSDTSYFFDRRISSIAVDPREGKDAIVVTFDGYNCEGPNVAYINNVSGNNPTISYISLPDATIPAYSAMIENTTGEVYVGTEEGVFRTANVNNPSWQVYGAFKGVPVTSMYQVTYDYPMVSHLGHDGVTEVQYYFPKTKYANAMYFGTYGRGIFMDMTYVSDSTNEVVTPEVYLEIPTVNGNGDNSVRFYPNPAVDNATMELTIAKAGNAVVKVYDLTGKVVYSENMGRLSEGIHTRSISCQNLQHGMYLVNVTVAGQTATSKLIVK